MIEKYKSTIQTGYTIHKQNRRQNKKFDEERRTHAIVSRRAGQFYAAIEAAHARNPEELREFKAFSDIIGDSIGKLSDSATLDAVGQEVTHLFKSSAYNLVYDPQASRSLTEQEFAQYAEAHPGEVPTAEKVGLTLAVRRIPVAVPIPQQLLPAVASSYPTNRPGHLG